VSRGTQPGAASPRWRADLAADAVLDALRAHAEPQRDGTLVACVGSRRLAEDLGWSRRAVCVRLRELERAGRVRIVEASTVGTTWEIVPPLAGELGDLEAALRSGDTIAQAARRLGWSYGTTQRRAHRLVRMGRWPS
jgi:hypothetical protein